ncbi:MAG TPA: ABC transporter substrate-binding protein [Xanthobacteraceae bacterium]|jgi:ABC-type nitrate/sulfonate/bicarbonate transport system substrate-binding protein
MTTRRSLLLAAVGSLTTGAIGARVPVYADPALAKVKVVIPQNSVFVLSYLGGKDAGVFSEHGIDLDADPRPFAGFLAGLPSKQCMTTTYSGMDAIQKINEGLDWVVIGGGLTVVQDVIVRKSSPFNTPADLRGKKFGTFSTGAGSFKASRAAIIDAYKLDIVNDTQLQQVAGPALTKLLERGDIDAMINISSLTLAAEAQADKFRVLFSPNDYWRQKTGYPIVWAAPIVAWRSWVDEDTTRAKNFAAATAECFRWLRKPENLQAAVKKHGVLAGVTKPEDIAEYEKWLGAKKMFMTQWDRKAVDAQWKFLEMAHRTGILDKVPPEDKYALFVES